jgi:Ser/Thr protein kinase RdoA (MazF antagonist)
MKRLTDYFTIFRNSLPAKLNKEIIKEAALKYGLSISRLNLFRAYGSYIFEAGNKAILRISHSEHKNFQEINAHSHWQQFLHSCLPQVVEIVPSVSGKLAEPLINGDGNYSAVLLKKSKGIKITDDIWNKEMFIKIGKLTGKLHKITKMYNPDPLIPTLNYWHKTEPEKIRKLIPPQEYLLVEKLENCFRNIENLPVTNSNFGIVHNDIHRGNMLFYKNDIILFDFEDSCYSSLVKRIIS